MKRIALLFLILPTAAWAECKPADIQILQADWRREDRSYVKIVGEIKNNCAAATLPELSFTFRDTSGKVVDVQKYWARGSALAPGERAAFAFSPEIDQPFAKMETTISNFAVR